MFDCFTKWHDSLVPSINIFCSVKKIRANTPVSDTIEMENIWSQGFWTPKISLMWRTCVADAFPIGGYSVTSCDNTRGSYCSSMPVCDLWDLSEINLEGWVMGPCCHQQGPWRNIHRDENLQQALLGLFGHFLSSWLESALPFPCWHRRCHFCRCRIVVFSQEMGTCRSLQFPLVWSCMLATKLQRWLRIMPWVVERASSGQKCWRLWHQDSLPPLVCCGKLCLALEKGHMAIPPPCMPQ